MPAEYYTWLETLQARDTIALGAAAIALILFLVMARQSRTSAGITKTNAKTLKVWEAISNKYYLALLNSGGDLCVSI